MPRDHLVVGKFKLNLYLDKQVFAIKLNCVTNKLWDTIKSSVMKYFNENHSDNSIFFFASFDLVY